MTTARSSLFRDMVRTSLLAAVLVLPTAFAAAAEAPFKAAFTISESIAGGGIGCSLTGTVSGLGHASHLGKASLRSLDCIVLTNPPFSFDSNFSSGNLALQAANGDYLYATYNGTATQRGALLDLTGTFTLKGGTGRFAHATGTGKLEGLEDISGVSYGMPAVGTVMLSGKISY